MHLFLAPHFDDVALSCGGEVARVVSRGEQATIATIFGGAPAPEMPLTPYAQGHLVQWGVASLEEAFRTRRAEDEAAARALGVTPRILPFVDGVFREDHYRSWDELRGQLVPAEADVPNQIAALLVGSGLIGPDTVVTGPLAIGRHVDHQLVYAAMCLLAARGVPVRGYEDFPYATQGDEYEARMRAVRLPRARVRGHRHHPMVGDEDTRHRLLPLATPVPLPRRADAGGRPRLWHARRGWSRRRGTVLAP